MMKTIITTLALVLFCSPAWALKDRLKDGSAGQAKTLNTPMREDINLNQIQKRFEDSPSRANHKKYIYAPDFTMKIRLREYMNTTVVLPENENIRAFSLGDKANFSISAVRLVQNEPTNLFEVWGKFPGADTSLKVYGESGNIYLFYIKIDSVQSAEDPTLIVYIEDPDLKEFKPKGRDKDEQDGVDKYAPKKQSNKDTPDYLVELKDVDPKDLNFAYQVADPDSKLAPIRVFDDGNHTYFQFGEKDMNQVRDLPAFYRVVDGTDQPFTNLQKKGGYVIATTTHDKWTLRSGRKWLCIRTKK